MKNGKPYKNSRYPALKPGDWVDTGWYTTGEVVSIDSRFENYVTVRFGAELYNLDRNHTRIKLSRPEPGRSLKNIFSPGQWIMHDTFGKGMIVSVGDVHLSIRFDTEIRKIGATRTKTYVSPLPISLQNIDSPVEKRRTFFDTHPEHKGGMKPCLCCGYPTTKYLSFGFDDDYMEPAEPCIVCGWKYDHRENPTPPEMEEVFEGLNEDFPNGDYSLTNARKNFEARGTMYQPKDVDNYEKSTQPARIKWRNEIIELFDALMKESRDENIQSIWSSINKKVSAMKGE